MKRTPPRRIDVWGAAKVNIGWRVGERRPDGYHEVCGLVHTVSVTDRLRIDVGGEPPEGGAVVDVGGEPVTLVVTGSPELMSEQNLVVAAARALGARAAPLPTAIRIDKSIPVAAGLGGGSADAAAALVGLNAAWGAGRTPRELVEVGAEIGSDVGAILVGGLVHASGRGEHVRRLGVATEGRFVIGVGSEAVESADAYACLDELRAGSPAPSPATLHANDLEPAACALVPALRARLEAMREAAGVAFVAGSGPTVVGAVSDLAQARDAAARVREVFADVVVAQPLDWGVRLAVGTRGR